MKCCFIDGREYSTPELIGKSDVCRPRYCTKKGRTIICFLKPDVWFYKFINPTNLFCCYMLQSEAEVVKFLCVLLKLKTYYFSFTAGLAGFRIRMILQVFHRLRKYPVLNTALYSYIKNTTSLGNYFFDVLVIRSWPAGMLAFMLVSIVFFT